nr:uncharacterized protein LOC129052669 [Pongo abelii]XP_054399457.1 uncharacterized protein LOC129052669 [Pongo abelii]
MLPRLDVNSWTQAILPSQPRSSHTPHLPVSYTLQVWPHSRVLAPADPSAWNALPQVPACSDVTRQTGAPEQLAEVLPLPANPLSRPSPQRSSPQRTKSALEQALQGQLLDDMEQSKDAGAQMRSSNRLGGTNILWFGGAGPACKFPHLTGAPPLPSGSRESPCSAEFSAALPCSPGSASPSRPGSPSSGDNIQRATSVQSLSSISSLAG